MTNFSQKQKSAASIGISQKSKRIVRDENEIAQVRQFGMPLEFEERLNVIHLYVNHKLPTRQITL